MQSLFLTRYSFFGKSDWRSEASNDPDVLLDPARLEQREALFEKIALRSLADQSDPDFKLVVLSSKAMPKPYKKRLTELCADMIGERAHVMFKPPRRTAVWFTEYRQGREGAEQGHDIQSILDDDDGVATNFVERIKAEARVACDTFGKPDDYTFISHARGVNIELKKSGEVVITHRNMPCTTQGLSLVAAANSHRSPFNVAHKKIIARRPLRILTGGPVMYVRAVHNFNDSRALVGDDRVAAEDLERITAGPLPLLGHFMPRALPAALAA